MRSTGTQPCARSTDGEPIEAALPAPPPACLAAATGPGTPTTDGTAAAHKAIAAVARHTG